MSRRGAPNAAVPGVNFKVMTLTRVDGARQQTATLYRTESQATAPVSVDAAPGELAGKWTAHWVGRIGERPKMIGHIDFDFPGDWEFTQRNGAADGRREDVAVPS